MNDIFSGLIRSDSQADIPEARGVWNGVKISVLLWCAIIVAALVIGSGMARADEGRAPFVEAPPIKLPLLNPTPKVTLVTLPPAEIAKNYMCGKDATFRNPVVYACTLCHPKGCEIVMPPYPSQYGSKWWGDVFEHELEGHALRGLVHYSNGRGWKAP